MISLISLNKLIKNKVHLGHKITHSKIKNNIYIYQIINSFCIIDLTMTAKCLLNVYKYIYNLSLENNNILFIGTTIEGSTLMEKIALSSSNFYINTKWKNGIFTNWIFLKKKLIQLLWMKRIFFKYNYLFANTINFNKNKTYNKILNSYNGILNLQKLPSTIFILDINHEKQAFKEIIKFKPILISILDTNVKSDYITFPIPGNNTHPDSIKYILKLLTSAYLQGVLNLY